MSVVAESDSFGVLDRITAIFEAFDEDDRGLGISDLAVRAGLPKSTVSRLVADLVRQRYLERDGRMIRLGLRLFELGRLAEAPQQLRLAALPVMAELRSATGETVQLAIREGADMVYIAIMRGRTPAVLTSRIGGRAAAHATALGKAVLAHSSAGDLEAILSGGLVACTVHTITEPEPFRQHLTDVRDRRLATEFREFALDAASVATPVLSPSGDPVAAICVAGRADDFDPDRFAPALRSAASVLEGRLALGPGVRVREATLLR